MNWDVNWDVFWNAWTALGTSALVGVTIALAVVGFQAARWARRTFRQTEQAEEKKRMPFVSLRVTEPGDPQVYLKYAREGQPEKHWKWWEVARKTDILGLIRHRSVMACWAYNIGEGPALRIVVPYRLRVHDFLSDGSEREAESTEGEFEILHVLPGAWAGSRSYLDVTYYPKWAIELLVDNVRVLGIDNQEVAEALTATTEAKKDGNNYQMWEFLRRVPPLPPPAPPSMTPGEASGAEDAGEG